VWVEPGSDAAAKGLTVGDRVVALDGYVPTRRHFPLLEYFLVGLSPRPAVRFVIEAADSSQRTLDIRAKITKRAPIVDLLTFIRRLEKDERQWSDEFSKVGDEVLILRLGFFGDQQEIDWAMRHARGVATLILDLRGNPGGLESGLVRLAGHLFDRRLVVGTIRGRRETRALESRPVGHPFTGPLYVLIDSESGSSSEILARLVQLEGRGVVVGDLSAGLVMRSRTFPLSVGESRRTFYGLSITDADLIMPDGARLEGRGVQPDALVLPTRADLAAGRDPALAIALRMAGHPMDPAGAGRLLSRRAGHGRRQLP
jgi:carboxyl-terminal processing protease